MAQHTDDRGSACVVAVQDTTNNALMFRCEARVTHLNRIPCPTLGLTDPYTRGTIQELAEIKKKVQNRRGEEDTKP